MKITLIQTPWSDASHREFKGIARRYALYPPLSLLYLAAAAERAGHEADVIDLEVENASFDEICERIRASGAQILGITATTPVFHIAQCFARGFRDKLRLPIVVGGPHITVLPRESFTEEFDYAVVQEGEETLVELLHTLEVGGDLSKVKGILYRDRGAVQATPPRDFIKVLDDLPFPARQKLDPNDYFFEVPGKGVVPVTTTELTRGCPFKCTFCTEPANTGRGLRKRSAANVVDEMLDVKDTLGISHFTLIDSTLTLNRRLIEDFCHELINRRGDITWEGQTRANLVDRELLALMKQAGLVRMSFGVESADREVLRLMRKEVDPEAMRTAFRLCKDLGISTMCGTMIGSAGETRESILRTAWFIRSIPEIRYAPVGIAIPYPGTELYHQAEHGELGLKLLTRDFSKYSRYAGVMEVGGMTPRQLVRMQRVALIISHSTPGKIRGLIQHFGLWNLVRIGLKMLRNELAALFGGEEPVLTDSIVETNTTLKSLGMGYRRAVSGADRNASGRQLSTPGFGYAHPSVPETNHAGSRASTLPSGTPAADWARASG